MQTPKLEHLPQYALEDGVLTDIERAALIRKAQEAGMDMDEFEMILDTKLHKAQKATAAANPKPSSNKHEEVRKCPTCGAMVSVFTTQCGECGYEFNNVEANKPANTLFEELQAHGIQKTPNPAPHEEPKNKQLQALSKRYNSGSTLKKIFANNGTIRMKSMKILFVHLKRMLTRLSTSFWI